MVQQPTGVRRSVVLYLVLAAVLVVGLAGLLLSGGFPLGWGQSTTASAHATPTATSTGMVLSPQAQINAVALVAPGEGWAVGYSGLMLHYTGGTWVDYPTCAANLC